MSSREPDRSGALGRGRVLAGWALLLVGLPLLTVVLLALSTPSTLSYEAMLYLVLAVACALVGGRGPALAAAVTGTAALDYWFTAPRRSLDIAGGHDLATVAVLVLTSMAVATVVDSAARRRHRAVVAESEADTLALLNRTVLGEEYDERQLLELARDTFGAGRAELVTGADAVRSGDTAAGTGPNGASAPLLVLRDRSLPDAQRRVLAAFASHLGVIRQRQELARQTAAAQALEAGSRTRTALLAAVSHDLRTPLAGIRTAAETLQRYDDRLAPDERAELLSAIEGGATRLTRMVSDLLDMSRLQTGAVTPTRTDVALGEVVRQALADLDGRERVHVERLPTASADPALLERVLVNLLGNALRHSSTVDVRGEVRGRRVLLSVVDHGPGVAAAERTRMFEPFQRLGDSDSAQHAGAGVGLGLAVARGLTEAQGGTIVAGETPGGGLTMVLDLPGPATRS